MSNEEHTARTTRVFDSVADGYDREILRFFPFCADKMLEILQQVSGGRLLDIAMGTGIVTK